MPDFACNYTPHSCDMLNDAYDAVTRLDLWDWLRDFTPHPNEGFMLTRHPNLDRIAEAMAFKTHSGSSWAWTMRTLSDIAKAGGWDAYKAMIVARWPASRPVCPCRSKQGMTLGWCGVAGFGVPGCEH